MYFKIYTKFDQINAGLMTISGFLEKYEIVMYPNFWPIICIYYIFTLPLFNIWAPAPRSSLHAPAAIVLTLHSIEPKYISSLGR